MEQVSKSVSRTSRSNSTIISASCVGPRIEAEREKEKEKERKREREKERERGDASRSSFFSSSPLDASEPRQISPLFISSPSALLF